MFNNHALFKLKSREKGTNSSIDAASKPCEDVFCYLTKFTTSLLCVEELMCAVHLLQGT